MFWRKCKHPAGSLAVVKHITTVPKDKDFDLCTIHLQCMECFEHIDIPYAKLTESVEAFLKRGQDDR